MYVYGFANVCVCVLNHDISFFIEVSDYNDLNIFV